MTNPDPIDDIPLDGIEAGTVTIKYREGDDEQSGSAIA